MSEEQHVNIQVDPESQDQQQFDVKLRQRTFNNSGKHNTDAQHFPTPPPFSSPYQDNPINEIVRAKSENRWGYFNNPNNPTLEERWEMFSQGRTWKRIRPLLRPIPIIFVLFFIWLLFSLKDFEEVKDGQAYTARSKCKYPLVLYKDSSIKFGLQVAQFAQNDDDYETLLDLSETSACYLENYKQNMSCITPLAYGKNFMMISLRRKNGEIIHLYNPHNMVKIEKTVKVPESNSLLPGVESVIVNRPISLTVEYLDKSLTHIKKEKFEHADAFCIGSSTDLFEHFLPQLKNGAPSHSS